MLGEGDIVKLVKGNGIVEAHLDSTFGNSTNNAGVETGQWKKERKTKMEMDRGGRRRLDKCWYSRLE